MTPATAESGHDRFGAGEAYHLGLTLVGENHRHARELFASLRRLGQATVDRHAPPSLGGSFSLEAEPVESPDLNA